MNECHHIIASYASGKLNTSNATVFRMLMTPVKWQGGNGQDVIRHFIVFQAFPSVIFKKMTDLLMTALNVIFCYIMLIIFVYNVDLCKHHHKLWDTQFSKVLTWWKYA